MKFFKRKTKSTKSSAHQLSLPILIRQTIYDSMLTPAEEIANIMGLPRISFEVAEMEEQASEMRLHRISDLTPFIDAHSDIVAQIATAAYTLDSEAEELDGVDDLMNLFKIVSLASTVSCISTLVNLEIITSNVEDKDGE